jgi:hypothetical protein
LPLPLLYRYGPGVPQSPAQSLLRLARIMLAIQLPVIVVAGTYLFYEFGLHPHPHHFVFASILTGGYLIIAVGGLVTMQWIYRSRARRLAHSQPGSAG